MAQAKADVSNDVSKHVRARGGAWRHVEARDLKRRCMEARGCVTNRTKTLSGAWGRVRSSTMLRLSRVCRSTQNDLYGTFKTVIGAMFVVVMQMAVVCAMWNSLTTAAAGPKPEDDGWMMSEVQQRKATAVVVMAEAMLKTKNESH